MKTLGMNIASTRFGQTALTLDTTGTLSTAWNAYSKHGIVVKFPQTATYWSPSGVDGFGKQTFSAPQQIDVRWQERQELFVNAEGENDVSRAAVYCKQLVEKGGYLFLGSESSMNPESVTEAFRIKALSRSPNITATMELIKAWL